MRTFLIIMTLIYAFPAFSQAEIPVAKKRPAIIENKGTAQTIRQIENSLQEHQHAMELEKRATEKKLARLAQKNHKSAKANREKLKNRLKTLEAALKSIQHDKKKLAATRKEYQLKFSPLASIHLREKALEKHPVLQRDIVAIEQSEPSKNGVMAEIADNKDETRLMQIVTILIAQTNTMGDTEKEYWRNLPPSIPFEYRFRLLDILATERLKLAALERTYASNIRQLNNHQLAEWNKVHPKGAGGAKNPVRNRKGHHS